MPQTAATPAQRKCLIVEDSTYDQRMIARAVRAALSKVELTVVASIEEAREALATTPIALILLDNNLPDGKGANFALELAQDARLGAIPVIMVSDWPSPFMWQKAELAGVHRVFTKTEFNAAVFSAALPKRMALH